MVRGIIDQADLLPTSIPLQPVYTHSQSVKSVHSDNGDSGQVT